MKSNLTSENGVLQGEFLNICKNRSLGKIFLCKTESITFFYFQICYSSLSLPTFWASCCIVEKRV